MSKKIVNDKELYSISECVKEFIPNSNKQVCSAFVDFLVKQGLLTKEAVKYRLRKHYIYSVTGILKDNLMGHYYTEPKKVKGEIKNGTLYFDKYMCQVMCTLYLSYISIIEEEQDKEFIVSEDMLKEGMLCAALENYVPKIDE